MINVVKREGKRLFQKAIQFSKNLIVAPLSHASGLMKPKASYFDLRKANFKPIYFLTKEFEKAKVEDKEEKK